MAELGDRLLEHWTRKRKEKKEGGLIHCYVQQQKLKVAGPRAFTIALKLSRYQTSKPGVMRGNHLHLMLPKNIDYMLIKFATMSTSIHLLVVFEAFCVAFEETLKQLMTKHERDLTWRLSTSWLDLRRHTLSVMRLRLTNIPTYSSIVTSSTTYKWRTVSLNPATLIIKVHPKS